MAKNMEKARPFVPRACSMYIDTFQMLDGERFRGEGYIGSIPSTKVLNICEWHDIDDPESFVRIFSSMDTAYVNAVNAAQQRKSKMAQNASKTIGAMKK